MPDGGEILKAARARLSEAETAADLDAVKAAFVGKKGRVAALMRELPGLPPERRPAFGAEVNQLRDAFEKMLSARREEIRAAGVARRLADERLDVSLPGRRRGLGGAHPINLAMARAIDIFAAMGFEVADGPEIEDDHHNFTALNHPADHPARSMHDTFYVRGTPVGNRGTGRNGRGDSGNGRSDSGDGRSDSGDGRNDSGDGGNTFGDGRSDSGNGRSSGAERDSGGGWEGLLLRTHTSPVQVRHMRAGVPPYRVIAPGRVFRVDHDATHSPMFHQIEGLWVDDAVTFAGLKGVLGSFFRAFFADAEIEARFRPSFFPFTEPSAECDILRDGRWLEICGCGMVHPNVLKASGVDPAKHRGFAFGVGVERLAMLLYGVRDIRLFFENDLRFLSQFPTA